MNIWQERTIKALVNKGYDEFTASRLYARAYERLKPSVLSSGFNREFEAYMSLVSDKNFIRFDIKKNRLYFVDTGDEVSTYSFEKRYTTERLKAFSNKYFEVRMMIEEYEEGKITLQELNNFIKNFKKNNSDYHKEGS